MVFVRVFLIDIEAIIMERTFTASVWQEGSWFIAQCLEVDVASQGENEEQALASLREALELHFEQPQSNLPPKIHHVKVQVRAA